MATGQKTTHPRLNKLFKSKVISNNRSDHNGLSRSSGDYTAEQGRMSGHLRKHFGPEWIVDIPFLNPQRIREEIDKSPIGAAVFCQYACHLLGKGHRRRVAEYLTTAYAIACGLRDNDQHIRMLAMDVRDARTKKALSVDKVKSNLLHYLFIYIFFQSNMTTRDRATQYAQGLQPYFDSKTSPAEVEQRLNKHGPDRFRRAARLRAKRILDAQALAESGQPLLISMDEAVAAVAADDAAKNPAPPEDEPTDFGPREVPPDTEVSGESDADDDTSDDVDDGGLLTEDAAGRLSQLEGDDTSEPNPDRIKPNVEEAEANGFIDGAIINEHLQSILLGTMRLATQLAVPELDVTQQKQTAPLAMALSVEIVQLQRMIAGR